MSTQNTVPEDILNVMAGGYRGMANLFRAFVDVLEQRYGKEETAEIAREAVRRKGLAAGNSAADRFGRGGLDELRAAHVKGFPTSEVVEWSPTRYLARDAHCHIVDAWRRAGVSPERILELANLYCWGDLHYAQAFNPNIRLEFISRVADGSPCCQWLFTLDKE